jgi:hypothetical protein
MVVGLWCENRTKIIWNYLSLLVMERKSGFSENTKNPDFGFQILSFKIRIFGFHVVDFCILNQKLKFIVINSNVNKRTYPILYKNNVWTLKL